ncbi:MAG: hypothetical protein JSV56_00710 [Methanomassiliicoccales archaeon]|nr:MAG: hypothetical protein JSV56_00710 [Methanomassiliicoccales archaeon]
MGIATEDDIDGWLKEIGLESLQKRTEGNWDFIQRSGDSTIHISIMYASVDPSKARMIGVGCLFLAPPQKNQCELYKRLLEIQTITQETKFCIVKNGAIMLITHRSTVDLDLSELKEMIDTVINMYDRFHKDCLSIVS